MPNKWHVWVGSGGGYSYPGLVLAWRKTAGAGWEAQVAIVRTDSVLVEWVPAQQLHPIADDGWDPARGGRH